MKKRSGKILPVALKHLVSHPATVTYPVGGKELFPKVRGMIAYEASTCIGCSMCVRDCPTGAIVIEELGTKEFKATFEMDVCSFCAQCVSSCPKKSLSYTPEFELAVLSRAALKIEI